MVQEILRTDQQQNLGILVVDWKKGANLDWKSLIRWKSYIHGGIGPYLQAAANTRYVGVATERIVSQMDPRVTIHCIGHSLGAHVCGFLGQAVKEDTKYEKPILERITGMDPAGPYFLMISKMDKMDKDWTQPTLLMWISSTQINSLGR